MGISSRRRFLNRATAAVAGSLSLRVASQGDPLGMPMGFQIYGVREQASKNLDSTLKQVTALGYKRVELCSFHGYANSGFGPLADMEPEQVHKEIEDAGLQCESCHFQFREFDPGMIDQSIAYATGLGLKYMIMSSPKEGARDPSVPMDLWKWNFDHMNKVGERIKTAGMQFGYHNHSNEWKKIGDTLVFDELLKSVDPKFVQLQMDLGGTVSSGHDPVAYLASNPGRFCSLHVKDAKSGQTGGGSLELGRGDVDWKRLFAASNKSGVKAYYVEMEVRPPNDPMKALEDSAAYLQKLSV